MENQQNVKNYSQNRGLLNATKSSDCKALNVFYPMAPAAAQANRFKYNVSHYEVNLTPYVNGSGFTVNNVATTAEELQDLSVHFGGPLFHAKVVRAAQVANSPFTRNQTAGNIDELVNAFYAILYNSRTVYALLHTAFRCQDAVEAVDEDGLYLAPVFNDHYGQDLYLPSNTTATYRTDFPMTTYATQANRQALCFSSAMSNAAWARLWTAATTCVKLPKQWRDWCRRYFGHHHQVNPTNGDAFPRFVTFWPSARLLNLSSSTWAYTTMTNYNFTQTVNGVQQERWNNADMTGLQNFINNAVTYYQDLMNRYAQLEVMFRELKCNIDESFDFARDITGRTVRVAASYDVERLVYSVSMGYRIVQRNGAGSNAFASNADYNYDYESRRLIINRDPLFTVNKLDPDFIANQGPATFSYRDQVMLSDQEFALLKYQLAPLQFTTIFVGVPGTTPQHRRLPLLAITNSFLHAQSMITADGTYTYPIIGQAESELIELNSYQLSVLPRAHWDIQVITSPSTGEVNLEKAGYFRAAQTNHYNLKDYVVPQLIDQEWRDELCDKLTDSLPGRISKDNVRRKRSSEAKEVVGKDK